MVFFKLDFVSKIKRLLLFIKSIRVELGISYNKEVTDICKVSKIKLGIIPNKIVGINKAINKKNSLLLISFIIDRCIE